MQPPFQAYVGDEPYVFVSYAHADAADVFPEIHWLHENVCNVWYDEGISPGRHWRDELATQIDNCALFVVYLSPRSIDSEHCLTELSYALDQNAPILTIFYEPVTLPPGLQFALQNRQGIERHKYDNEAYRVKLQDGVARLLTDGANDTAHDRFARSRETIDDDTGVDRRYELHEEISSEPDGVTARAVDRVRGRSVTIKRDPAGNISAVNLAVEFEHLSSLRHPNIVTALDFGVEDDGREYLVLDLQEGDEPLAKAAAGQPVSVQVDLLSQALRALHHIHSKQLVYGVVGPHSLVVNDGRLKLLDLVHTRKTGASSPLPAHVVDAPFAAPELKQSPIATPVADIYSLAYVFYESITGLAPRDPTKGIDLKAAMLRDDVDARLTGVLGRMLEVDPERRLNTALDAFSLFDSHADGVVVETALTRESALQAAQFVGREAELEELRQTLESARRDQGGTVLISGESGVGKSRLLGELRRMALLSGFRVMRGHAVEGDTGSYRVWEEVTKHLDILTEGQRGHGLGGRGDTISDADEISFLQLEASFRKQTRPTLIILEDLHWAGTESVKLMSWLAKPVRTLPVVIVGTYRPNEAFDPGSIVEDVHEIRLSRLSTSEVAKLAAAVLGKEPDERLQEFLTHETEGNSLFIVETLRVLAEHAGTLEQVGSEALPERVLSGGMRRILNSRIDRLSADDMALLRIAALVGRQINTDLMKAFVPETDIASWAERCSAEAVLEEAYPSQRFTHEKLREFIVDTIDPAERLRIHRLIATELESMTRDVGELAKSLAYHWREIGDTDQEARFTYLAGEQMLKGGALLEAVDYFRRVEKMAAAGAEVEEFISGIGTLTDKLSEAYFRLGNLAECNAYAKRAVVDLGGRYPSSTLTTALSAVAGLPRMFLSRTPSQEDPVMVLRCRNYLRLTEIAYYSLKQIPAVWAIVNAVNSARRGGAPEELAQSHALAAYFVSTIRLNNLARSYAVSALNASRTTGDLRHRSFVHGRLGSWAIALCDWQKARSRIGLAVKFAERSGDLRLLEENSCLLALINNLVGDFDKGLQGTREVQELARRVGDRQIECWGAHGESIALIRKGRPDEARAICAVTLDVVHDPFMRSEAIATHSILAIIDHRADKPANAMIHINEALQRLEDTPSISWWVCSALGCLMEAVFEVSYESRTVEKRAKKSALKRVKDFARNQALGQPLWLLWSGVALAEQGKTRKAINRLKDGLERAESLKMSYEAVRIRIELLKLEREPTKAAADRESLTETLTTMGCHYELDLISSLDI